MFFLLLFFQLLLSEQLLAISLDTFHYSGASVLPITSFYKPKEKKWIDYVILAREASGRDRHTYDDFGGKKEKHHIAPIDTAANEFWEEAILYDTLNYPVKNIKDYIQPSGPHTKVVIAKKSSRHNYVTFITKFDNKLITTWRNNFHQARSKQKKHKFKEKDRIATVRWKDLEQAIKNSPNNSNVLVSARLIDPNTKKEKNSKEPIKLRPKLVWMLRPYIKNWKYISDNNSKVRFNGVTKPKKTKPKPIEPDLHKLLKELEINLLVLSRSIITD